MIAIVRVFMAAEALTFLLATFIRRGFLLAGQQHQAGSTGESVIAFVLLVALLLTWISPRNTRLFGLRGQGFALLGTLVGLFTIAIGVARTIPDLAYHLTLHVVLAWGFVVTLRAVHMRDYRLELPS